MTSCRTPDPAARSRIDQLRDASALDRWLARIAENLCYQVLRRSALQDRHQARFADPPPVSDPALRDLIERLPLRSGRSWCCITPTATRWRRWRGMLSLSYPNTRAVLSRTRRRMYRQWSGVDR